MWFELFLLWAVFQVVSWTLFFFPNLLYKKLKPRMDVLRKAMDEDKFVRIIHRGGPRYNFENTIPAFRFSIQQKADFIEFDVQPTKHNEVVVFHDKEFERLCGKKDHVCHLPHHEFPHPLDEAEMHFNLNRSMKKHQPDEGQPHFPLLKDVLALEDIFFNLEVKYYNSKFIDNLIQVIKDSGKQEKILVALMWPEGIERMKEALPKLNFTFEKKEVMKLFLGFPLGLLPFIPLKRDVLQPPYFSKAYEEWELERAYGGYKPSWVYLLRYAKLIMGPIIGYLRRRGVPTMPWVVNEVSDMETLRNFGALGVVTDEPVLSREWTLQKGINIK